MTKVKFSKLAAIIALPLVALSVTGCSEEPIKTPTIEDALETKFSVLREVVSVKGSTQLRYSYVTGENDLKRLKVCGEDGAGFYCENDEKTVRFEYFYFEDKRNSKPPVLLGKYIATTDHLVYDLECYSNSSSNNNAEEYFDFYCLGKQL